MSTPDLERHPCSWTYDPEAGAAYIYLDGPIPPGGVARTVEVDATVNLDYGPDGRIIGIEILAAWPAPLTPPAATFEVTVPHRAFDLRGPCACGSTTGRIENKNGQACIYCAECSKYQYNASRFEIDRHRRGEFLAELTDLYGYPVKLKDDPTASEDAVLLRIGSEIHNQDAFCRLPEGKARELRDALSAWLGDR